MTIASQRYTTLFQRRRLLVFCAATLVLHGLAIDWAARQMAFVRPTREAAPPVTAELRLSLPKRAESKPLAEVQPVQPVQPVKAAPPAPALPLPRPSAAPAADDEAITPVSDDVAAQDGGADPAALATAAVGDLRAAAPAQPATSGAPPAVAGQGAAAAAPAPAEAPPQNARRYKVQLPPSATFEMNVARVDADGTKWTGAASMTWHTDGSRYQASVEAGVSLLVTRVNLLVLRSEGTIDDNGIAPDRASEKRARRAETATHFNRDQGTITFSASDRSYPLLAGAQDKATVPFQLAGIGRGDVNQFGGDIDIQVGEDREASMFRFQLVGEEELDTKLGKLVTWHLTRPPKPGTYSSRLDIWLAPGMHWYPVQMRNTEASGALTTQTISNIKISETGQ